LNKVQKALAVCALTAVMAVVMITSTSVSVYTQTTEDDDRSDELIPPPKNNNGAKPLTLTPLSVNKCIDAGKQDGRDGKE
jgi:hypothetical protein